MYPSEELSLLALRKTSVRARLSLHRCNAVIGGRRVAAAVNQVDEWRQRIGHWGRFLPMLAPLIFGRRRSVVGFLLKWLPMGFRIFRGFRGASTEKSSGSSWADFFSFRRDSAPTAE